MLIMFVDKIDKFIVELKKIINYFYNKNKKFI